MKIVNFQQFCELPPGTLFSKYTPQFFEGLMIKGDSIYDGQRPIDFFYQDLIGNVSDGGSSRNVHEILAEVEETGCPFELDFYLQQRDGTFEHDQLFAIYDDNDKSCLIERLSSKN